MIGRIDDALYRAERAVVAVMLGIVTYVPWLSTWLPGVLF